MERKLILIADPNRNVLKDLGNAFHDRGYDVRAARDGSQALEKAILVHPDLVLFDEDCPLIAPKKFVQILRSNPRTEHIPVIVISESQSADGEVWGYREALLKKPFNPDEVLSLVSTIFRRMATALQVSEGGREIEGSLLQISLVDLLQIFNLNRKTGLLELKSDDNAGRIYVQDGSVVHTSTGRHRGEKALFRMLLWRKGSFAFIPEKVTGDMNIRRSTDMLLLEGARQIDELEQLRASLPDDGQRLVSTGPREKYDGLHPVTQEILNLLEFYSTCSELIDHARVSDYEACRAIRTLLDKGVLKTVEKSQDFLSQAPLLDHEVMYELKVVLARNMFSQSRTTRGKICLLCSDQDYLIPFLRGLRRLAEFDVHAQLDAVNCGFGLLGQLVLNDSLLMDVVLLPLDPKLRPLWRPLSVSVAGALIMRVGLDDMTRYHLDKITHDFLSQNTVPILHIARPGEESIEQALAVDADDPAQVRAILVQLLHKIANRKMSGLA